MFGITVSTTCLIICDICSTKFIVWFSKGTSSIVSVYFWYLCEEVCNNFFNHSLNTNLNMICEALTYTLNHIEVSKKSSVWVFACVGFIWSLYRQFSCKFKFSALARTKNIALIVRSDTHNLKKLFEQREDAVLEKSDSANHLEME